MSDGPQREKSGSDVSGFPVNYQRLVYESFAGLNTKPTRPAIADQEMAWCDGWMPLGPGNLRTLPDVAPAIYQPGQTIVWHNSGNLGTVAYFIVLLQDGSMQRVNEQTGIGTQVLPAGTILNVNTYIGATQWTDPVPMIVITSDQNNGYWLWDGANLFTAGTVSPEISVTDGGENYDGSAVTIQFLTTGSGVGATYTADIVNGSITRIRCTNPGSGFAVADLIALYISGGGSDTQAQASVNLSGTTVGGVDEVVVTNGGQGYTAATQIQASGGGGTGAAFSFTAANGVITDVIVLWPGSGYTSPPSLSAVDPGLGGGAGHIAGGTGFIASCTIAGGQVTGFTILNGGTNYISPPDMKVIGDGQGCEVIAQISGGAFTGYLIKKPGKGYNFALVEFSGGNSAASATTVIFPFGISGTAIESFNNQVWIANGGAVAAYPPRDRVIFSAPGSVANFDPTLGGGAFSSNNNALKIGYFGLKQSNGFLYLFGDSAIDQVSGVQSTTNSTTGNVTTTFVVQSVDPQIGTPWPASIQLLNRDIVFANSMGVYILYGGTATKVSDALDGFYTSPQIKVAGNLSSAIAEINGRYVYMLLLPTINPVTGFIDTLFIMWDGKKWWTSHQSRFVSFISTLEINSQITCWGTDGALLFQNFAFPGAFPKTVLFKLSAVPGYQWIKDGYTISGIVSYNQLASGVNVYIDTESSSQLGAVLSGNGLQVVGPIPAGNLGRLMGLRVVTNDPDVSLISLALSETLVSPLP